MSMGGGGGGGGGISGSIYSPQNQPGVDLKWNELINPLFAQAQDPSRTPGGVSYGQGSNWFGAGDPRNIADPNNPYLGFAQGTATNAANAFTPWAQAFSDPSNRFFQQALGQSQGALTQFKQWGDPLSDMSQPYYGLMDTGARIAAQSVPEIYSAGLHGMRDLQGGAGQLFNSAGNVLNTAFDPQNALYDRTQQRILDQTQAANAASGVASTPYGAGLTGDAMRNFNIDWQNNLLNRQATGIGAAGQAIQGGGNALTTGTNLGQSATDFSTRNYAAPYNSLRTGAATALDALKNMSALSQAPYQLGQTGAANAFGLLGNQTNLASQPYQIGATGTSNALSGLSNLANIGNNQYALPAQILNNLQSYLQLGQSASQIGSQIGQNNFQNLASGIGGASNLLFGSKGLGGESGLLGGMLGGGGGLGSLFGGGAGIAPEVAATGGLYGAGEAAAGGGGLAALLPFAASA